MHHTAISRCDVGNHCLRTVRLSGGSGDGGDGGDGDDVCMVGTLAGSGAPGDRDGPLATAPFNRPFFGVDGYV